MVRLNRKAYDRRRFADHGLAHYDLYFPDGRLGYSTSKTEFILTNIGIYSLISNFLSELQFVRNRHDFICMHTESAHASVHTETSVRKTVACISVSCPGYMFLRAYLKVTYSSRFNLKKKSGQYISGKEFSF